jgi:2-phospho-L-lactate guanylyltransferase (CobY/MobA/RfbA family)
MFGSLSYAKHLAQARAVNLEVHEIERLGLCSDLDTLQDLRDVNIMATFVACRLDLIEI